MKTANTISNYSFRLYAMRLILLGFFFPVLLTAQNLSYSPGMTVEKTVSLNYYNTEYLFIENLSDLSISLQFEIVSANLPEEWAATGCTNMICYVKIPDSGPLGTLAPHEQAYISINLAVNETAGDGEIVYAVFDEEHPELRDTVRFVYHANTSQTVTPQPWAHINFAQNILTVFLENAVTRTTLSVFDLQGNQLINTPLEEITSYSLAPFAAGVYVAIVRNENGKELVQRIVKSGF